jgi:hypothetical protein
MTPPSPSGTALAADPAPVAEQSRIESVDIVRGIALLGILLLDIPFFAMPERFTEPWRADTGNVNFWAHAVNIIFFEGKMRALSPPSSVRGSCCSPKGRSEAAVRRQRSSTSA